jgi:hypothetical protein
MAVISRFASLNSMFVGSFLSDLFAIGSIQPAVLLD